MHSGIKDCGDTVVQHTWASTVHSSTWSLSVVLYVVSGMNCLLTNYKHKKMGKKTVIQQKRKQLSKLRFVWFVTQHIYSGHTNLTSVVSTLIGSVYFSVAVPSGEKKQMWRKIKISHRHICWCVDSYQVPMTASQTQTQPPQPAPLVPLPPRTSHSDESVLCQSNHSATLCPACPSVTCLEQREHDKSENQSLA